MLIMIIGGIPVIRSLTSQPAAKAHDAKALTFVRGALAEAAKAGVKSGDLTKTEAKKLENLGKRMVKLSQASNVAKIWHAICFCIQYICAKSLIKSIPDRLLRVQCGILDNFHTQGKQICENFGITTEKFNDELNKLLGGEQNVEVGISHQLYLDLYRKGFDLVLDGVSQHCQIAQLPEEASTVESDSDLPASVSSTADDRDHIIEMTDDEKDDTDTVESDSAAPASKLSTADGLARIFDKLDSVTENRELSTKILYLAHQGMFAHMFAAVALGENICLASGPIAMQLQKEGDGVRCILSWSPSLAEHDASAKYGQIKLSNSFLFKKDGSIQVENFKLQIEDVVATIRDL